MSDLILQDMIVALQANQGKATAIHTESVLNPIPLASTAYVINKASNVAQGIASGRKHALGSSKSKSESTLGIIAADMISVAETKAKEKSLQEMLKELMAILHAFDKPGLTLSDAAKLYYEMITLIQTMKADYGSAADNVLNALGPKFAEALVNTVLFLLMMNGVPANDAFYYLDVMEMAIPEALRNSPPFADIIKEIQYYMQDRGNIDNFYNEYQDANGLGKDAIELILQGFFNTFFSKCYSKILQLILVDQMKGKKSLTEIIFLFMYGEMNNQNAMLTFQGQLLNLLNYLNRTLADILNKFDDQAPNKPGQQTGSWPSDGKDATEWAKELYALKFILQTNSGLLGGNTAIGSALDDIEDVLNKLMINPSDNQSVEALLKEILENPDSPNVQQWEQEIATIMNSCYPSTNPIPPPPDGGNYTPTPEEITYEQINQNIKAMISLFSDQGQQVQLEVQQATTSYNNMFNDSTSILSSIIELLKAVVQNQKVS